MARGQQPKGCPTEVDAIEVSSGGWPADDPFPLTADECLWLLMGYAVRPHSGPMTANIRHRLPRKIELIRGWLHPE